MNGRSFLLIFAFTSLMTACGRPSPEVALEICGDGVQSLERGATGGKVTCIPPEAPLVPDVPEIEGLNGLDGLSDAYAPLPISNLGLDGTESPQDIADKMEALLGAPEPVEGAYSETSEVIEDGANVIVRFEIDGLPDDSVKGTEHIVTMFLPAAVPSGVTGYGWRQKCWRAEDPDAWTTEPCP